MRAKIISRTVSLLIALTYVVLTYLGGGNALAVAGVMVFVLALIWYGDAMGQYQNNLFDMPSYQPIDQTSPGALVALVGWIFLLLPIVLIPFFNSLAAQK